MGTGTFDIDRRAGLFARGPHPFKAALFVQCMVVSNNHRGWPSSSSRRGR
jgi:hypothetical protein